MLKFYTEFNCINMTISKAEMVFIDIFLVMILKI